jgi:hypothetical protein
MKTYTVFNAEEIVSLLTVTEETLLLNINEGETYVEGSYPDDLHYVKNNQIRAFPEKPYYPVDFDKDTEQWVWDETLSWAQLRAERDALLRDMVDPIVSNPLRWAGLTLEEQQEYADYRQSLLDLPANTTDPKSPLWPISP